MLSSSFVFLLFKQFKGERWAFLIAGSKGYANYRHQADLFHAYHVLVAKNFSSDKIILMAYNDIAFDQRNPKPGKVFNRPYDRDVYANVQIDYQGEDTVFIYMTGHGSVDFFYLPDDTILSGHILVTHLNQLATRCKSVLVIIESCNSGSLFQDRENILRHNILILTSADPRSPSFACYWTSDLMAYLGDEFSTAVFENLEKVDVRRETLSDLYLVTRIETQMSHVCVYGRKSQLKNAVSEYVGYIEDPYKTVCFINS
ncbi:hypothetical protein HZS_3009 [Henneguya salminicola]|nr:hypothetical protein HZS_3009 [Henneguya salminicola]